MSRQQSIPLGIVVERREIDNEWEDYAWSPVAVIPGAPPLENEAEWKPLGEGDGWVHYHAATLDLELFAGETEGYKTNLTHGGALYVVLLPGEEADEPEVIPHLVTACPFEAEDYMEDSEIIVEAVAVPDAVRAWIEAFIEEHHVERDFKKRKQKKAYDPRKGDMRPRPLVERD